MTLVPGAAFGPYRVIGLLGAGGMALVYHAMQPNPQREVALKVISAELAVEPSFRARFQREANVLARLEHPNILPIYEAGTIADQPYICYRLVRGGTLRDLMGAPWSVSQVVSMLAPVADALDFAHSQGVIHRDIKPSNILLTLPNDQGVRTPIVADFGLARILQPEVQNNVTSSSGEDGPSLTQAGAGIGTPAYMAPEQALGKPLSGQTDQYALAVTAYQALTGAIPFSGSTPVALALMHVSETLPPASSRNPALTPAVDATLLKALSKEPRDRFPTCAAFIQSLAAAIQPSSFDPSAAATMPRAFVQTPTTPLPDSPLSEVSFTPIPRAPRPRTPMPPPQQLLPPAPPQQQLKSTRGGGLPRGAIWVAGLALLLSVGVGAAVFLRQSNNSGANHRSTNSNIINSNSANRTAAGNTAAASDIVGSPTPNSTSANASPSTAVSSNTAVRATVVATPSTAGFADGSGAAARFNGPSDIAMDAAGNLYVADNGNNRVRKITPDGTVVTLAGSGKAGYQNGPGFTAQFSSPECIAVDAAGNVYVGDYDNDVIRKITADGMVSTLSGSGTVGFLNGGPGVARFGSLNALAVDTRGIVYVADAKNNRIRIVEPNGTVDNGAGTGANGFADGPAATAEFSSPYGLAIDSKGTLYVADGGNNRIRKITSDGRVTTLAGSGASGYADGAAGVAQFQSPAAVAVDSRGTVYVSDSSNFRIRQVATDGTVTTLAGTGTAGFADGPVTDAQFGSTQGLAVGFGALYVTDYDNNSIRRVTPDGSVTSFAGSKPPVH